LGNIQQEYSLIDGTISSYSLEEGIGLSVRFLLV